MSGLLQSGDRAREKLADGGDADSQGLGDLAVLEPFGAQVEALPLLRRERLPCVCDLLHPFPLDEIGVRTRLRVAKERLHASLERLGALLRAPVQAQVVSHAENPSARILNELALAQREVEAQKNLLGGLLRVRRR